MTDPNSDTPTHAESTDRQLRAALGVGDRPTAARLLIQAHAANVGRAAFALLGSQSDAEQVLEETLRAVLDGVEPLPGDVSIGPWLLGQARRRAARRSGTFTAVVPRVTQLLAQVRPTEREAVVLRFASRLGWSDLCVACNVDEATAKKRVSRGLARVASLFDGEEP